MLRRVVLLVAVALFAFPAMASAWVDLYARDQSIYGSEPMSSVLNTYTPVAMPFGWVNGGRMEMPMGEFRPLYTDAQWRGIPYAATTQPLYVMYPDVAPTGPVGYIVVVDNYFGVKAAFDASNIGFGVAWNGASNSLSGWQEGYGQTTQIPMSFPAATVQVSPLGGAAVMNFGLAMFARVYVDGVPRWRMRLYNALGSGGIPFTETDSVKSGEANTGPSVTGASLYAGMLSSNTWPSFRVVKDTGAIIQSWETLPAGNQVSMSLVGGMYSGYTTNAVEAQKLFDGINAPDVYAQMRSALPSSTSPTSTPGGTGPVVPPSVMPPGSSLATVPVPPSFTPTGTDWSNVDGIKNSIGGSLTNLGSTLLWPLDFVRWAFAGGAS